MRFVDERTVSKYITKVTIQQFCFVTVIIYRDVTVTHHLMLTCSWLFWVYLAGLRRRHPALKKLGAVLGKNIWGAWPLIIWEATTSRTTVSNCPVLSNFNLCTVITLKMWGAGQDWGAAVPPRPQPRTATVYSRTLWNKYKKCTRNLRTLLYMRGANASFSQREMTSWPPFWKKLTSNQKSDSVSRYVFRPTWRTFLWNLIQIRFEMTVPKAFLKRLPHCNKI